MILRQAFRYELALTPQQRVTLVRHAGTARWAWNWGLAYARRHLAAPTRDPQLGRAAFGFWSG